MAEESKASAAGLINSLAVVAAIVCAFFGYGQAEWPGAAVAAGVAYVAVWLVFQAINVVLRMIVLLGLLVLILAALKTPWDWIQGAVQ